MFRYNAVVSGIPSGARRVDVWVPLPRSDQNQVVDAVKISAPAPYTVEQEREYGNSILHFAGKRPADGRLEFHATFEVRRREARSIPAPRPAGTRFLAANRLVPVTGTILSLAREVTQGKTSDLEKARAIYDYVVTHLKYDKSGVGWGRGDALWACEVKRGNCTDFHSLLIAMARAVGIPARFKIGFPLPEDSGAGKVAGYHCWAELYINGRGWVPVDSSEASKHPERTGYYFGTLDPNRVEFTSGRDLRLSPPQAGPPLNFFIYPYVEVDKREYDDVQTSFSFAPASSQVALRMGQKGP